MATLTAARAASNFPVAGASTTKGVMQVGLKLYPRIWLAPLPLRVKLEMFFRLTGNISYPLMIVASFLQFPLLLVRYNQPFYHLMVLDLPLLFFSSISVVLKTLADFFENTISSSCGATSGRNSSSRSSRSSPSSSADGM